MRYGGQCLKCAFRFCLSAYVDIISKSQYIQICVCLFDVFFLYRIVLLQIQAGTSALFKQQNMMTITMSVCLVMKYIISVTLLIVS